MTGLPPQGRGGGCRVGLAPFTPTKVREATYARRWARVDGGLSRMKLARFGAVEAGGTNGICMVGYDPDHIVAPTRIPTWRPTETLGEVFAFFQHEVSVGGPLAAIGIASFGPLELRRSHPRYGFIRKTPKPGWSDVDMVGPVRSTLGVPVGFDTDVNAAALAEGRWGAARDLKT